MAKKFEVGLHFVSERLGWVLEVIKNMNFPAHRLGGNDIWRLRHVPCLVHLSCMVDLRLNLNPLELNRPPCLSPKTCHILLVVLIVSRVLGSI
jgi:hypothetical protein